VLPARPRKELATCSADMLAEGPAVTRVVNAHILACISICLITDQSCCHVWQTHGLATLFPSSALVGQIRAKNGKLGPCSQCRTCTASAILWCQLLTHTRSFSVAGVMTYLGHLVEGCLLQPP
jgi:hypothetical protein